MSIVLATIVIFLLVINLLGLLVIGLIVNSQSRDNKDMDKRLTTLEARVNTLPTHTDLASIREDISSVVTTCAGIDGRTEAMALTLSTIQRHLMESNQ